MACAISFLVGTLGALAAIFLAPKADVPVYLIAVAGVAINIPLGSAQSAWAGPTARLDGSRSGIFYRPCC